MAKHPLPKIKREVSAPGSAAQPKRRSPSPEKVTSAVVAAVIDQVAAAFTTHE